MARITMEEPSQSPDETRFSTLCPELHLEILDHVESFDYRSRRNTIAAFCRTSKKFYIIGIPRLYHHIQFDDDATGFIKLVKFSNFLAKQPALAAHVRILTLKMPSDCIYWDTAFFAHVWHELFEADYRARIPRRCYCKPVSRVGHLHKTNAVFFHTFEILIRACTNLAELSVQSLFGYDFEIQGKACLHGRPGGFSTFTMPHLLKVTLLHAKFVESSTPLYFLDFISRRAPNLKTLTFDAKIGLPRAWKSRITLNNLSYLNMGSSKWEDGALTEIVKTCQNLRSFSTAPHWGRYDFGVGFVWAYHQSRQKRPTDLLSDLSDLQSCATHVVEHHPGPLGALEHVLYDSSHFHVDHPLAGNLPPNLKTFVLVGLRESVYEDIQSLADVISPSSLGKFIFCPIPAFCTTPTHFMKLAGIEDTFREKRVNFGCFPLELNYPAALSAFRRRWESKYCS